MEQHGSPAMLTMAFQQPFTQALVVWLAMDLLPEKVGWDDWQADLSFKKALTSLSSTVVVAEAQTSSSVLPCFNFDVFNLKCTYVIPALHLSGVTNARPSCGCRVVARRSNVV